MGLGKLGCYMWKNKFINFLIQYTKISSKWIKHLNIRWKTIKPNIEENIGNLFDICLRNSLKCFFRETNKNKQMGLRSVQPLSHVRLFVTPWIATHQASLSITSSRSSLKLLSIESVMPSSHLILCHSLFLLTPIPPNIRVFSNESTLWIRWPKYWSFSFSISPSKEIPGLISFRMDWLDLIAVPGTLKSLLQHHSSKASILQRSAFFTVQLSHPYMTTGKTIALTRRTFVGKVMSLAFSFHLLH